MKKILFVSIFILAAFFIWSPEAHAAAYNASDLLGQIKADGSVDFTTRLKDNARPTSKTQYGPMNMAIDGTNHRLFVTDFYNNRVLVYNLDSSNNLSDRIADNVLGQADFTSATVATTQSGMNGPFGLAYNSASSTLFVSDSYNNRILVFDVATITDGENAINVLGQSDFTHNSLATTQNGMYYPYGMEYNSTSSTLFVADLGNNRVLVFNVATITDGENAVNVLGQADFTHAGTATTQNGMYFPYGVEYNSASSTLFVADTVNRRVLIFDLATITDGENAINVLGQSDFTHSNTTTPTQSGLYYPVDVVFNSASSTLFVSDGSKNRVMVFDVATITDGENAINVLGQTNFTSGSSATTQNGMYYPYGMAYNSAGKTLFVGDYYNNRMMVFDVATITDGENAVNLLGQLDGSNQPVYTSGYPNMTAPNAAGLNSPADAALDATGHRLFVPEWSNNRVLVFNLDANNNLLDHTADYVLGQSNFTTVAGATTQSGLSGPARVLYNSASSTLFVADGANNRVLVFDVAEITNGENAISVLGQSDFTHSNTTTPTRSGLSRPNNLAYDSVNNILFVADDFNYRVLTFDVATITDGENAIHVLGQSDFTSNAHPTTQAGLYYPSGLAYDSANKILYVSDQLNHRIVTFDVATIVDGENAVHVLGQADFTHNSSATTRSGLQRPDDIEYDAVNKYLFVADYWNHRIMVFDVAAITDGEDAVGVLGEADYTSNTSGVSQSLAYFSSGVGYDSTNNRLYVTEWNNHRVAIYNFVNLASASLGAGFLGTPYSQPISSIYSQGTLTYALQSGSLPPGLSLSSGGSISGTPTTLGTYSFTIRGTDTLDTGTYYDDNTYSITVTTAGVSHSPAVVTPASPAVPATPTVTTAPPAVPAVVITPPPAVDPNTQGTYSPASAKEATPSLAVNLNIVPITNTVCTPDTLIKSNSSPSVYYCGEDGLRYVFANESVYFTWFKDFADVKILTDAELAQISLGHKLITHRPGIKMIKIQTDPKVYAVARGGILRWVKTEAMAKLLYGDNWNTEILDVSDALFVNYTVGEPVGE